jgi:hypothetical protein
MFELLRLDPVCSASASTGCAYYARAVGSVLGILRGTELPETAKTSADAPNVRGGLLMLTRNALSLESLSHWQDSDLVPTVIGR